MNTPLEELRTLRAQIKSANARIQQIVGDATQQAVNILAEKGKDRGEFTLNGHKYQLQVTDGYDFGDFHKYKDPECVNWRAYAKSKTELQDRIKALTKAMDGQLKMWITTHNDYTPDTTDLTVKCID